jgi:hypothetical protein
MGVQRTKSRSTSRFGDKSVYVAYRALKDELSRLNATYVVVSTNIPLKANGEPYSDPGRMPDPGAAVYFRLKDKSYCLPCDRWLGVEENLYAIAKHIEAMRGMERWGVGSIEQTFAGFRELPSFAGEGEDWRTVLGLGNNATPEQVKQAHRLAAIAFHPDKGGSVDAMARINLARDRALKELR